MIKKKKNKSKIRRGPKLNTMMSMFIMVCWLIPIIVFGAFILVTYRNSYVENTDVIINSSVKNYSATIASRVNEAIKEMWMPTYDGNWEAHYLDYKAEQIPRGTYYRLMDEELKLKFYYYGGTYDLHAFYLEGEDALCYRSKIDTNRMNYRQEVDKIVEEIRQMDTNYTQVFVVGNRVFLARNMYTLYTHKRFGTFVVSLNMNKLLDATTLDLPAEAVLMFNDDPNIIIYSHMQNEKISEEILEEVQKSYQTQKKTKFLTKTNANDEVAYLYGRTESSYRMGFGFIIKEKQLFGDLQKLYKLVILMFIIFLPLSLFAFWFIRTQIEKPVEKLIYTSREIQSGKIGTVCEGFRMPNREFADLIYSFNNMSSQVKYLFDTVYKEKLERKDAQIAALQSQINPHFLNNTLEMMNWQARMTGDIQVSKMIEALGTVLEHSINRKNEPLIYLSEELRCADAYLYIMSMRYGQRLKVEREIDSSLLQNKVPTLILQPLLENAILYGIDRTHQGEIRLKIHHDDSKLYLEIYNTGEELDTKAEERIAQILDGTYNNKNKKHISIGVRNVNMRIKLLFGEAFGLSIKKHIGNITISKVELPYGEEAEIKVNLSEMEGDVSKEEELAHILDVLNS